MVKSKINKLMHSVFFRLLAAIVVVAIALTITSLAGFIVLRHNLWESLGSNLLRYARYLAADIGEPPSRNRALAIAQDTQMVIRYTSPSQNWITPAEASIPDITRRYRLWHNQNGIVAGSNRKGHFVQLPHGDGRLFFWLDRKRGDEQKAGQGFLLFHSALLIILTGAYMYIRRVMQPIHWLTAAMDAFGRGNLDYRMPLKRHDEFQDLAESMNKMAAQIQALMQSKESLLLDVSHELRSPLARLKVGLELLPATEMKTSLKEDLCEMEAMVTEILEAYRLHRFTDHLLIEEVEILPLIQSVVVEFSGRFPGIQVLEVSGGKVRLDMKKTRVVLRNVLDNALKYSFNSSRPVEVSTHYGSNLFKIYIVDHGIGISADSQKRVFEPFFRADPSRSRQTGGFGLGLSMCKAIMDAHGGSIEVSSEETKGTLVTICFPLNRK